MTKAPPQVDRIPTKSHHHQHNHHSLLPFSFFSPKLSIFLLATCVTLFILFHIQSLHTTSPSPPPWPPLLIHQRQTLTTSADCNQDEAHAVMADKLRQAVTFLPLKDLRYSHTALQGHTWFMSSLYDTHEEGEVQYQKFPSQSSNNRLLCLKGSDAHDGAWNSYALAWPETLPYNATLMKGLTFVSYNHYNYDNIWHGLSAVLPFVCWHLKNNCAAPNRWILYHWGEIRAKMELWLGLLMEATFGGQPNIEVFEGFNNGEAVCFEEAVVMRHNEGGMSRERRMEAYDLMRCKAREFCNVSSEIAGNRVPMIGITMLMRTGARSFKNRTAVVEIFQRECGKVDGCRVTVAYSNNLSFCDQVKLMSKTDILVSPHGAQLTNMFLMDRNSSVMEFFPKGWLKLAGVGQYVFRSMASWSGMRHQGAWRDPDGDHCPYPDDDRRCMSIYKSGRIGHNETYFSEWTANVLSEVKTRKMEEASKRSTASTTNGCACSNISGVS